MTLVIEQTDPRHIYILKLDKILDLNLNFKISSRGLGQVENNTNHDQKYEENVNSATMPS